MAKTTRMAAAALGEEEIEAIIVERSYLAKSFDLVYLAA